jgi:hypothetical protein
MQKSPSHVHSCTGPSRRRVYGISRIAARISLTSADSPVFFAFVWRNASISGGGYSSRAYLNKLNSAAPPLCVISFFNAFVNLDWNPDPSGIFSHAKRIRARVTVIAGSMLFSTS